MPNNSKLFSNQAAPLTIDGAGLTIEDVVRVARQTQPVEEIQPGAPAAQQIEASAGWVQAAVEENARRARDGEPARAYYGINTGFGIHAAGQPMTDPEYTRQVSRKLVMSHATGVGDYLDEDVIRATMLIRANTLARGRSGVRLVVINRLIQMLNRGVIPAVPRMGSLGASGDLAPLAHLALALSKSPESLAVNGDTPGFPGPTGEALVPLYGKDGKRSGSQVVPAVEAMTWDGADNRIVLEAKEGLALTNGSTFSAGILALALYDAENLVRNAEIALAMSLEALQGYRDAFLPQIHDARGHPGQVATASNVRALIAGSKLVDPGDVDRDPVHLPPQDPYSTRCAPQVIGAVRESLAHVRAMLEREINAATDNPLIFVAPEDGLSRHYKVISGGNFHGEYIAFGADYLGIALTELGSISERRTFWLLNAKMSRGLPSMLVAGGEHMIDSGLMIAQYVAASLVSRCKTLAHPDSVDSIPTSADQEDHVSMSMNAALHAREIVDHITSVVAIEVLSAAVALRHRLAGWERDGLALEPSDTDYFGAGTRAAWAALQQHAPQIFDIPLDRDVAYYPYLRQVIEVVKSGALVEAVRAAGIVFSEIRSRTELTTS
jgi:histidine ammonia-lyase